MNTCLDGSVGSVDAIDPTEYADQLVHDAASLNRLARCVKASGHLSWCHLPLPAGSGRPEPQALDYCW
jgi:hypothetical protein